MVARSLLGPILADENLTRGLGDAEARMLVEWLVERTEEHDAPDDAFLSRLIQTWCRRARSLSRFVILWCYHNDHGAACQLAATERFSWPLPNCEVDPCDLMHDILAWEQRM